MADQKLSLEIDTTSNVSQQLDKSKGAVVSFSKQVEDIQKKFSTAFKDVFLSFLGPMALLGVAISYIGKLIADNQRKHAEANQSALDGTNELMSAEDRYWARKQEREKKTKETVEQAKVSRQDVTQSFLKEDPRGKAIMEREIKKLPGIESTSYHLARKKMIQDEVQALIAEDAKKNPAAGAPLGNTKDFKGPEGFSNVVGVGANPVIEAMNEQLEIQKQQLEELKKIASPDGGVPKDFTKDTK